MSVVKLYDRWDFDNIVVSDIGLKDYLNVEPIIVPRTNGYYHNSAVYKKKINIIERIMNRLQVCGHKGKKHKISTGHNTGKAKQISNIMFKVLEKIEEMTKQNPIQVVVSAIENASPREEVITIERSGAKYAQAVDISPLRRLDLVIRYVCQGAAQKAFNSKKSLKNALIDEIMDCYNKGGKFVAMTKKTEIEKMAASTK